MKTLHIATSWDIEKELNRRIMAYRAKMKEFGGPGHAPRTGAAIDALVSFRKWIRTGK